MTVLCGYHTHMVAEWILSFSILLVLQLDTGQSLKRSNAGRKRLANWRPRNPKAHAP